MRISFGDTPLTAAEAAAQQANIDAIMASIASGQTYGQQEAAGFAAQASAAQGKSKEQILADAAAAAQAHIANAPAEALALIAAAKAPGATLEVIQRAKNAVDEVKILMDKGLLGGSANYVLYAVVGVAVAALGIVVMKKMKKKAVPNRRRSRRKSRRYGRRRGRR